MHKRRVAVLILLALLAPPAGAASLADSATKAITKVQALSAGDISSQDTGLKNSLNTLSTRVTQAGGSGLPLDIPLPDCAGTPDLARCSIEVRDLSLEILQAVERIANCTPSLCNKLDASLIPSALELASLRRQANETVAKASMLNAQYGIFAGPNYSLGADGDWHAGLELLMRFDSAAQQIRSKKLDEGWWRLFAEVGYQSINALDDEAPATAAGEPAGTALDNPFLADGGYFRANGGMMFHFNDWIGVQGGMGFSSRPSGAADAASRGDTNLYRRYFAGLHVQRVYEDGVFFRFSPGFAHDEFWQREVADDPAQPQGSTHREKNFNRFNVDIFGVTPLFAKIHGGVRVFMDAPVNRRGPSDVRVSLLLYYDLPSWLGGFKLAGP